MLTIKKDTWAQGGTEEDMGYYDCKIMVRKCDIKVITVEKGELDCIIWD